MIGKHFLEFTVAATWSRDGRVTTAVTRWYCGWVEGEMCAVSRAPENVSRTSVAFGVASLAILLTGFVTGSWVTTREPYRVPGTDSAYTAAAFRIGLWKICPTLRKTNSTMSEYHMF
ncbi:MOB kinase activator-like 2 [Aphis craccivora]|uniref:MOB kinase activator-like 2 n=1 Tax=Aphis craccivora TaxID=307492 RepID=A0A6G0Z7T8_APHCR|nr:MOB kinase activator-like 2 [Aphis craccivora]